MKCRILHLIRCLFTQFALAVSLSFAHPAAGAVLEFNPASVPSDFQGQIRLVLSSLSPGQSVRVEKFADINRSGSIDPTDLMLQSFSLTDGQSPAIDGVRNPNIPADDDTLANGQIRCLLQFGLQETDRAAGQFIYRVWPTVSSIPIATGIFSVLPSAHSQRVNGRVISAGVNVPQALVALLKIEGDQDLVAAGTSDASGNYTLTAPPGTYIVVAFKTGFLFDFQSPPVVTLTQADSILQQNIPLLAAGSRRISGRVVDSASQLGIAGMQIWIQSATGLAAMEFSDATGAFSAPVSSMASDWELSVSNVSTMQLGYLEHAAQTVSTTAGNVTGLNLRLVQGSAMIYGRCVDSQYRPLSGLSVRASQNDDIAGNGITDADGNYAISVTAGEWHLNADESALAALGLIAPPSRVNLSPGRAVRADLIARSITARLRGRVVDETGAPIPYAGFGASDKSNNNIFAQTDSEGRFDLAVFAGSWQLQLNNPPGATLAVVGPDLMISVVDGQDITGINYAVRRVTARLSGSLRNSSGQSLAQVPVYGSAILNGQTYRVNTQTDANGLFQLNLFNGVWKIGVACAPLSALGLECLQDQSVTIIGNGQFMNFIAAGTLPPHLNGFWSAGRVQLRLQNLTVGQSYLIEISPDLKTWTQLAVLPAAATLIDFTDTPPPGLSHRFYRARIQ